MKGTGFIQLMTSRRLKCIWIFRKEPVSGEDKHKIFEDVGVHYPFQVERETVEPVMRTPIMVNDEQDALKVDFDVPEGTRLRFSVPPDFDIVENVIRRKPMN